MKLVNLLRKDLMEGRKSMMVYGLTMFCVMLLISLLSMIFDNPSTYEVQEFYPQFFFGFLFLGGLIISSLAYTEEMYGKSTQHNWMMTPASPLEKLAVKVIITAIIYPVALLLFISLSSLIIEGFNRLVFGVNYQLLNPAAAMYWKSFPYYIVASSIFLMGSAYFRKAAFIKTVLGLGLMGFVLGIISMLVGRIVFTEYFSGIHINEEYMLINNFAINFDSPTDIIELRVFEIIGKILFWVFAAPFCWVVSYFRIREVQAYDAV